ncbi:hypothetical protein MHBO_002466 [Bonamia ostreae]|uniref:Uncharacterized protein n=1 Tax=Bonamia ostreae TaxID=126728 RepID=A0ABV2AMH0_9EUKA
MANGSKQYYIAIKKLFLKSRQKQQNIENNEENELILKEKNEISLRFKLTLLFLLFAFNTITVLVVRESFKTNYNVNSAVLITELSKFVISFVILNRKQSFKETIFSFTQNPREKLKIMLIAFIYAVQNILVYISVKNLESAIFQVLNQMKILSAAVFSVLILKSFLGRKRWLAIFILVFGISIVQIDYSLSKSGVSSQNGREKNFAIGLWTGLAASTTSGFAGVFFEKTLKSSNILLWERNVDMSLFAVIFLLAFHVFSSGENMLRNFNLFTVLSIACNVMNGLVVSLVIKYADNILKAFAVSISIVVCAIIDYYRDLFTPSLFFVTGVVAVLFAVQLYSS